MAKIFQVDSGGTLLTDLLAYFKLEDITDFWSTYDLTNNNSVTFVAAKINNGAYVVAASNKYLNVASDLGVNGVISFSCWFKPDASISATQNLVTLSNGGGADQADYYLRYTSSGTPKIEAIRIKMGIGTSNYASYNVTLPTDAFSHLAITYTNSGSGMIRLYLNGSEVANAAGTGAGNANDGLGVGIGTLGRLLGNNPATGVLDEVGIWSKVLSTTEITDLYNVGNGQTMINGAILTETATLVDTLPRSTSRALAEMLTLTDIITAVKIIYKQLTDALVLNDSIIRSIQRIQIEVIALTDTIAKSIGRVLLEILTLTDTAIKATTRILSETVVLVDIVIRTISRTFVEVLALLDTAVKETQRALSETIILSDILVSAKLMTKELLETIVLNDTIVRSIEIVKTETIALADTITRSVQRTLEDIVTLADSAARGIERAIGEAVTLVDNATKQAGKNLIDALTLTDTFERALSRFLTLLETIALNDTIVRTIAKVATETITLADAVTKTIGRTLAETITLLGALATGILNTLARVVLYLSGRSKTLTLSKRSFDLNP